MREANVKVGKSWSEHYTDERLWYTDTTGYNSLFTGPRLSLRSEPDLRAALPSKGRKTKINK